MELILIILLICMLVPGSASSPSHWGFGDFAVLIAGIVIVLVMVVYWAYTMAGIVYGLEWLGANHYIALFCGLFGPIVIPMMVAGALDHYHWVKQNVAD